jgi:hypothetical protein
MRRINGIVRPKRTHPNATGFQKNLYRTEGVAPHDEQQLEVNFMKPLDTEADLALKKITAGSDTSPWSGEERSAWTRFILSLMFRNPAAVEVIKSHIAEMWDVSIKAFEENYRERRLPSDPPTFAEYFARTHPAAPQIGATNMLAQIINNDRVGPTIFNMHWSRIDLRKSKVGLLYSDRPLVRPWGLADKRAYIALPIGPYTLFLAAHDPELAKRVSRGNHTKTVKMINKAVVSQAREFVWGVDDSQLGFVQRHMGTALERVIITEQQRTEAIAAARGSPARDANSAG